MKPTPPRRSNRAVLNEAKVRHIRESREPGKVLAIDERVSEATISLIRNGKRWGWVR